MKTIEISREIHDYLTAKAGAGETLALVLKRELSVPPPVEAIEIDDDTYRFLLSKSIRLGEAASDILQRELGLGDQPPPLRPDNVIVFRIAAGTGAGRWNTSDTVLVATVGDTLRIMNEDAVPHRLHTDGAPFPHAGSDIMPGAAADFVLVSPFEPTQNGPLHDHSSGRNAEFWIRVGPRVG